MIRVLIYSDIRIYRDGLAQVLHGRGHITVVGAGDTFDEVIAASGGMSPDVILLDMANTEALRDVRRFVECFPTTKIVALGVSRRDGDVIACAEAGVAGYVFRDASLEELHETIESAAHGELRCSPAVAATLLRRVAKLAACQGDSGASGELRMTKREREILDLIENGLSNKQIAARLFIEIATVKNHIHNILEKLGVATRTEAAAKLRTRPRSTSGEFRIGF